MKNIQNIKKAYTHAGVFHADDVFSTALLMILNPAIEVSRVFKAPEDNEETLIYDIGEGEFDHHQKDAARRPLSDGYCFDEKGVMQQYKYAAFGLLWKEFGRSLCVNENAWKKVDSMLVLPIDKADNGYERNMLSAAIHVFNPAWNSQDKPDDRFWEAMSIAYGILWNYITNANADEEAAQRVMNAKVIEDHILVLSRYMPWQDVVINQMPEILYVVFPSNRGGYNVQTVPSAPGSFTGRKGFPQEWLGNPDASLGMTFCHPGNFILSATTEEQAINIAKIAVAR